MSTPGRRVYPNEKGEISYAAGDYGKGSDGIWRARPPGASMGTLENHTVTEHEDGTITVVPSILIDAHSALNIPVWHGFLERGNWRLA